MTIEALAGKVRAGGRVDAAEALELYRAPRRRSSASSRRHSRQQAPQPCRDLHHRPERELHEHLRRQVQLLRVLSSGRSSEGYVLGFDELFRKIDETIAVGGVQLLLQGGHNPDLPLKWYEDLFRAVKERYPSFQTARAVAARSDSPLADVAVARAPGDRSADGGRPRQHPGGGAEILVDRVRQLLHCYGKATADEWLDVCATRTTRASHDGDDDVRDCRDR